MTNQLDEIHDYVQEKLRNQLKTDEKFKLEMDNMYYFYERKLMGYAKTEAQRSLIENGFEEVLFSQYFQGYYVMKSILVDEETNLNDSVWSLGLGLARNEAPKFIKEAFKDEDSDWESSEVGHRFGMRLLQDIELAFDVYRQIRKDITNYGVYKAFIEDERYVGDGLDSHEDTLLGTPFDLNFISPQVYMQAQYIVPQHHEIWDLLLWSTIRNDAWVGTIHLSTMLIEEQSIYILEIKLSNTISSDEKMDLANEIITKLPADIKRALQTRLYHVEDFDVLIPNVE